jgi:fucose 4-O-acetylase-like acetyltransferase
MVLAMTQPLQPAAPKTQAKVRDPWLDNVKMVLVTIVVVGHMMVLVPEGPEKSQTYDFIYYFHIPAFVLLTGYLSRSFRYSRRHLWGLATTMVVPYVVFSWLMIHWRQALDQAGDLEWFLNPRWPMWYLAATVIWRLLTPLLRSHPVIVPISVAVSLLGGLTDQDLFDLNRAMGFLPFFVIGLHLTPDHLAWVRRPRAWVAGVVVLLLVWWLADHTDEFFRDTEFLYFRAGYSEVGAGDAEGIWIRARLIMVALVAVAAVLTLIPHRRSFITRMGVWSLVVYLCHGFVVRYLEYRGYADWLPGSSWLSVIITVTVGVVLALLVAWEPVATTLNYVVDPVNSVATWLRGRRRVSADP